MRFGLRTMLIVVTLAAISIPLLRILYQHATYLPLNASSSGWPTAYDGPYIHCMTAHDPNWGRVRFVFLHRIGTEAAWKQRKFLGWLDFQFNHQFGTRIFVDGTLVAPRETVLVYYADGDASPQFAELDLAEVPLRDPWWADAEKLWEKLHP
jgi:hypothetical protein